MKEEIEKILDETPYLDYEAPDINSMANQILTLLAEEIRKARIDECKKIIKRADKYLYRSEIVINITDRIKQLEKE